MYLLYNDNGDIVEFKYRDVIVNYIKQGKGGKNIILLHGWGQNISMMSPIADNLSIDNTVYTLDLPGHGNSTEPTTPWNLIDFVDVLYDFISKNKIKDVTLIGHSFGGEIALLYASIYKVEKLVLLDSPYRPIKKLGLKTKILKLAKKIPGIKRLENFAKKHMGSTEYRNASSIMRQILVNSVNSDITEEAKKVTSPTVIIWGTLDDAVPLSDGEYLESIMQDAGLITYENCTHYAYLERINDTNNIIRSFIGG